MPSRRDRLIKRFAERQDNARGMGLARDVRAGQAKPTTRRWGGAGGTVTGGEFARRARKDRWNRAGRKYV